MKLGIMQPYFFPYLEYFRLISDCDMWIGFDTVKYNRRSWMSRNRIINKENGWSYISVPVSQSDNPRTVASAAVNEREPWRKSILDKLRVYEHAAPNYTETADMVSGIIDCKFASLADLNISIIRTVCKHFGVETKIRRLSELNLDLPEACPPGEWALRIGKAVGATSYVNAAGGKDLFDTDLYRAHGLPLSFHKHIDFTYGTGPFEFVPDLSIIDTLMWVDHEQLIKVIHGKVAAEQC